MYVEKRINELEERWVQGVGARSLCGKVEESVKYVLRPANRHPSPPAGGLSLVGRQGTF